MIYVMYWRSDHSDPVPARPYTPVRIGTRDRSDIDLGPLVKTARRADGRDGMVESSILNCNYY